MERWVGKIAVVTGASAGVGYETAKLLVQNGMKVVGLARNIEKIEELQKSLKNETGQLHPFKADLSKEEDIQNAFDWIKEKFGTVHVLINNAAVAFMGQIIEGDPEKWRKIFDLNVIGLCVCTKAAFQLMKETKVEDGHIININSMVGHNVPRHDPPIGSVYSASKFAVTALTETIRHELQFNKYKIRITSLSPGIIKTDFGKKADDGYLPEGQKDFFKTIPGLLAEDVANTIKFILSTPPHVQIHELIFSGTALPESG